MFLTHSLRFYKKKNFSSILFITQTLVHNELLFQFEAQIDKRSGKRERESERDSKICVRVYF